MPFVEAARSLRTDSTLAISSFLIQRMMLMRHIDLSDDSSMDLRAVNLNLLAAFATLYDARSVTRAARRAGVTQSAMSNSLAQLRRLFDDPLFLRTARGIEPTPRADALAAPIRRGLLAFSEALMTPSFDPRTAERTFAVATSDYVELVLIPIVLRLLAEEAPGIRIEVRPWGLHEVPPLLATGEADLMIGYYDRVPPNHRDSILFEERYVCVLRQGHPRVKRRLTLAAWTSIPHVLVSQKAGTTGSVDRALRAVGRSRTIGARVSHFLLVPPLVARTDMVAAIGERVALAFAEPFGLRVFEAPIALPVGRVGMVHHVERETDPAHRYLREVVARAAAELG